MPDSRALVMDLCSSGDLPSPWEKHGIEPLPGRALLRMAKPSRRGAICLPDLVQHACDVGVLVAGRIEGVEIGSHVVVRPYAGLWLTLEDSLDGRLIGVGESLADAVIGRWNGEEFSPLFDWIHLEPVRSLGASTGRWKPLRCGPAAPDWAGNVDSISASCLEEWLWFAPGWGMNGLAAAKVKQ